MSIDVVSIIPEIIITCVGLLVLLLSVFIGKKFDKAIAPITAVEVRAIPQRLLLFQV